MSIDDIATIQISATAATPSKAGFGTPMIAAYHTLYTDLIRSYTSLKGMTDDGFSSTDPAYQMARTIFAQRPRVKRVKIGRRQQAFAQEVELTPEAPSLGKVYSLKVNGLEVTYTALSGDNLAAVCTALATALNAQAETDADALVTSLATSASLTTLNDETELNGVIGLDVMDPPRAVQATFSAHGDFDATTMTVTGKDKADNTVTDTILIPNGGGATVKGTNGTLFSQITSVSVPAQSGTGGAYTVGVQGRFEATGASGTKVVVTTTSDGMLTTFGSLSDTLALKDVTADPGIANDLADIRAQDPDWYGALLDSNSAAEVAEAAAYLEALRVIFCAQTADSGATVSGTTTDIASVLKSFNYARTGCWFHPDLGVSWLAAGIMGKQFVVQPGSDTWAYKQLSSVQVYELTDAKESSLKSKRCNYYIETLGVACTLGGYTSSGEWLDVVRFIDWMQSGMQTRIFALLLANKKIPYTDEGIALVVAEVEGQMGDGIRAKGISTDEPYTITAPAASEVDSTTRSQRLLPNVEFSFRLAGAIHAVEVNGTVTS